MKNQYLPDQQTCAKWSNRILILSLLGIDYLTLFPFRIRFAPNHFLHRSPFLLGDSGKRPPSLDVFLNILLFIPFGFGVYAQACKRGIRRLNTFFLALALGAAVSYTVELLQLFIPGRDSGWADVVSNTTGSVAGSFLFALCGVAILRSLSRIENSFAEWLSPRRVGFLLLAYFALCFGVSAWLQGKTRLSDWYPQCVLNVGNDASGQSPWKGRVFRLQIWDRALPEKTIEAFAGKQSGDFPSANLAGSYDFTGLPPYQDSTKNLPELAWTPVQPQWASTGASEFDARGWLRTATPAETLTRKIVKSGQFTVHVVCEPASTDGAGGRIVSLSQSDSDVNFHLRQEGTNLVFWFRDPLSNTRSILAWTIRGAFQAGKVRDIVASYNGSDAFIYLDGNRIPQIYHLSPGATLLQKFFSIRTSDLEGYVIVYETVLFLPAGLLIGVAAEKWSRENFSGVWILAAGLLLPAILLEIVLAGISGRSIWAVNIALSVFFGLEGVLLVNADRIFEQ